MDGLTSKNGGQAPPDPAEYQRPLRDLFISLSGRKFVFIRPGGNWGDHLIYLGADYLAKQLGLSFRTLDFRSFTSSSAEPGEVIYVHGGGGYSPYTSGDAPKCLEIALRTSGAVVVNGPCTIGDVRYLSMLKPALKSMRAGEFHFFARERLSHEICENELPSNVRKYLNDDTALYLDRLTLSELAGGIRQRINLLAVREDVEGITGGKRPNAWESAVDPARFARSFRHWVRIHAAAKTILTNRTHSAICGAVLGIPTTVFSNAYHKNRSMWEFSLKRRGVKWFEGNDLPPSATVGDPLIDWIPIEALRKSWKVRRIAKRLRGIPLS